MIGDGEKRAGLRAENFKKKEDKKGGKLKKRETEVR